MPQPLVLRQGRIAQELPGEAGLYPLLRVVAGRMVAGGAGTDLILVDGRIRQVSTGFWDGGATIWRETVAEVWDGGATTWDGGATTWSATDVETNWT